MKNKINRNKETLQKLSEQNREVITQYIDITRKATLDNKSFFHSKIYPINFYKRKICTNSHSSSHFKTTQSSI